MDELYLAIKYFETARMGSTKSDIHTETHNRIATIAKVFAHPARVAILEYISKQEDCNCSDLVMEIGLSQATISQHLQVIRTAGLIVGTTEGKNRCYGIDTAQLKDFQEVLNGFYHSTQKNCCTSSNHILTK